MDINDELNEIMDGYIKDFLEKKSDPDFRTSGKSIIYGSFPIIWFGDLDKYLKSGKTKIVTIAINPSNQEFEEKRFANINLSGYNSLSSDEQKIKIKELANTLNEYYYFNPYDKWFNNYNKILNVLGADYKNDDNSDCVAIHIDIYSAIATNPTWKKLKGESRKKLPNPQLFKKLLDFLDPDYIFYSSDQRAFRLLRDCIGKIHFEKEYYISDIEDIVIDGKVKEKCKISVQNDEKRIHGKNYIRIYKNTDSSKYIFWGANIQIPFSVYNDDIKMAIFNAWLNSVEIENELVYIRDKNKKKKKED